MTMVPRFVHAQVASQGHIVKVNCIMHCVKSNIAERIGGVMVIVIASSAVDRGFEPLSGQAKDYAIGSCCFSAKHASLRSKNKDWLARNQKYVSEWSDMAIRELLFQ